MPKPLGMFSRAHIETEEMFSQLQALSMLYIKEQFGMEDDSFKLEGASWEQFFKERERAEKEGTIDQFDKMVLEQIMPAIQQMMQQEEPK